MFWVLLEEVSDVIYCLLVKAKVAKNPNRNERQSEAQKTEHRAETVKEKKIFVFLKTFKYKLKNPTQVMKRVVV